MPRSPSPWRPRTRCLQLIKRQRLDGDPNRPPPPAAEPPEELQPLAAAEPPAPLVLVWDLDETLLIFNSLLTGALAVATRRSADAPALATLGVRWERAILALCDSALFFDQLEEYDQTCLADVQQFDDGADLARYDFSSDGFPPPRSPALPPRSPGQHAAAARPAPELDAASTDAAAPGGPAAEAGAAAEAAIEPAGAAATADGGPTQQGPSAATAAEQQQREVPVGGPELLSSPASRGLDPDSLVRLAYRYRRIAKLCSFGLAALGTAAQRQEWEVRAGASCSCCHACPAGCSPAAELRRPATLHRRPCTRRPMWSLAAG